MTKYLFALVMLMLVGCASSGGASGSGGGGLPEIAAYDEPAYDALPDMVPSEPF